MHEQWIPGANLLHFECLGTRLSSHVQTVDSHVPRLPLIPELLTRPHELSNGTKFNLVHPQFTAMNKVVQISRLNNLHPVKYSLDWTGILKFVFTALVSIYFKMTLLIIHEYLTSSNLRVLDNGIPIVMHSQVS